MGIGVPLRPGDQRDPPTPLPWPPCGPCPLRRRQGRRGLLHSALATVAPLESRLAVHRKVPRQIRGPFIAGPVSANRA